MHTESLKALSQEESSKDVKWADLSRNEKMAEASFNRERLERDAIDVLAKYAPPRNEEYESIEEYAKDIMTVARSREIDSLLYAGVSLKAADSAGILHAEYYYPDGTKREREDCEDEYWFDVKTSMPVLASYFSDSVPDAEKQMMREIIHSRASDTTLSSEQRLFLEQHSDIIADRLLHGSKDLSEARADAILAGIDGQLERANRWRESAIKNGDTFLLSDAEDAARSGIAYAIESGKDFGDSDDIAVKERYIRIQNRIREVVNDPIIFDSLIEAIAANKEFSGISPKEIILEYGSLNNLLLNWYSPLNRKNGKTDLSEIGFTAEEIMGATPEWSHAYVTKLMELSRYKEGHGA